MNEFNEMDRHNIINALGPVTGPKVADALEGFIEHLKVPINHPAVDPNNPNPAGSPGVDLGPLNPPKGPYPREIA